MNRRLFATGLTALVLGGVGVETEAARRKGGGKGGRKAPGSGSRGGCGSEGGAGFRKANGKCADKNGR